MYVACRVDISVPQSLASSTSDEAMACDLPFRSSPRARIAYFAEGLHYCIIGFALATFLARMVPGRAIKSYGLLPSGVLS